MPSKLLAGPESQPGTGMASTVLPTCLPLLVCVLLPFPTGMILDFGKVPESPGWVEASSSASRAWSPLLYGAVAGPSVSTLAQALSFYNKGFLNFFFPFPACLCL